MANVIDSIKAYAKGNPICTWSTAAGLLVYYAFLGVWYIIWHMIALPNEDDKELAGMGYRIAGIILFFATFFVACVLIIVKAAERSKSAVQQRNVEPTVKPDETS